MLWAGAAILAVGFLWSVFKGWVVWDIAHDRFNGGSAPTLDFPMVCPIPLAVGTSMVLSALDALPFPGFGFALYAGLAISFGMLLWWFYRLGAPERQRSAGEPGRAETGTASDRGG